MSVLPLDFTVLGNRSIFLMYHVSDCSMHGACSMRFCWAELKTAERKDGILERAEVGNRELWLEHGVHGD